MLKYNRAVAFPLGPGTHPSGRGEGQPAPGPPMPKSTHRQARAPSGKTPQRRQAGLPSDGHRPQNLRVRLAGQLEDNLQRVARGADPVNGQGAHLLHPEHPAAARTKPREPGQCRASRPSAPFLKPLPHSRCLAQPRSCSRMLLVPLNASAPSKGSFLASLGGFECLLFFHTRYFFEFFFPFLFFG